MPLEPPASPSLPDELLDLYAARVLSRPREERAAELERLARDHAAHAAALQKLFAALLATERILDGGFGARAEEPPREIGPYRVVRRIGAGAFGEVYLCEQVEPVRRQVAVKVLRAGVADSSILERFAAEGQLLAALLHPCVVHVFDAGRAADGRPYFAMEHVEGEPITRYSDRRRLPVEQRIELFLALCRGVQHAHERGIVHRDLKPANVLVVEHEGRALPKIIDFGIAKVLQRASDAPALAPTQTGRIVGTPGYMSPEQAEGAPTAVDARSDVYSLGVLLYELLTGELPFGERTATTELEPERPSRRISADRARTPQVAEKRATDARRLRRRLRGELDWIALKALRPERAERYASVAELAQDLERFRRCEPVLAGPPSAAYRLRRCARRHRVALAFAGVLVLLFAVGGSIAWSLSERVHASETKRSEETFAAVKSMLERASDPRLLEAPGSEEVRKAMLEDALALHARVLRDRSADRACRAQRMRTLSALANVHFWLAQFEAGARAAEAALEEASHLGDRARLTAADRYEIASAGMHLAKCRLQLDQVELGRAATTSAIELIEAERKGAPDVWRNLFAQVLVVHASALGRTGDPAGELAAQQRAIELLEEELRVKGHGAKTDRDLLRFTCGLARIRHAQGDVPGAEAALSEAQELAETLPNLSDEERCLLYRYTGQFLSSQERYAEAIRSFERACELHEAELQKNPRREWARYGLMLDRGSLCQAHAALGEREAAAIEGQRAIETGEALASDFVGRDWKLADILHVVAKATIETAADGDRAAQQRAATLLERALELTSSAQPGQAERTRTVHFRALVIHGIASAKLGAPLSAQRWSEIVEAGAENGDREYRARAESELEAARLRESADTTARHD